MKRHQDETDWIETIANKAGVQVSRVQEVLSARGIHASPVVASPRRLLIRRIEFSGVKDGVVDAGEFAFFWDDLDRGLWGMVTESNLKGKSSVIEVVRWLLRGRASNNLQDDVRRWIKRASMRFQIDETLYEIRVETPDAASGNLVRIADGRDQQLAAFHSDLEFEAVMSNLFLRELGLEAVSSWRTSSVEDEGKAVSHGWPTLSGVMFIGTNYSSLLGDLPFSSGIPTRLMQMYLGLPWISTLTVAQATLKEVLREQTAAERYRSISSAARQARADAIRGELTGKRLELSKTLSDSEVRTTVSRRSEQLAELRTTEQALELRLSRQQKEVGEAELAYAEDRRDLQAHIDAQAASAFFRRLEPTCCPRCDAEIGDERRIQEQTTNSCSICGTDITTDTDATLILQELTARLEASRALVEEAKLRQEAAVDSISETRTKISGIESEISSLTARLASFGARQAVEIQVAILEARLDEVQNDSETEVITSDELAVLNAIVAVTETRVKSVQADLLDAVSKQIVAYARRFGMDALSDAELKGNLNLPLVKGGQHTSYSKVTDGEKLRLKVATVLAMISVAEAHGVGRHPGLLMIDSPGAQEVSPQDLEELIAGLEEVSKEFKHLQVFIAALASPAIRNHVPSDRLKYAAGDAALW